MRLYSLYQTFISLGFILLTAHTEAYQQANWPAGRVIYVHPWVLFATYALGVLALAGWLAGWRDPDLGAKLDRLLPLAAWVLMAGGLVGMALFFPGPYAG